jgi:hypothetical protein
MGWLLLDNTQEALLEFNRLQTQHHNHPDVLELLWTLRARQSDWLACLKTGQTLIEVAPDRVSGWIHRAYALRRVEGGSLQMAWEALLPAADQFPDETIIPYNLACYACQRNDLPAARVWLKRAWQVAARSDGKSRWIKMALHDPDLEPLWPAIRQEYSSDVTTTD